MVNKKCSFKKRKDTKETIQKRNSYIMLKYNLDQVMQEIARNKK